jgi:uncharacterized protein (DUF4213/DUF364 family)
MVTVKHHVWLAGLAVIICEAAVVSFSTVVSTSFVPSSYVLPYHCTFCITYFHRCAVHAVQADGVTLQVFCELARSASNISSATGQAVLSAIPKFFGDQPCEFSKVQTAACCCWSLLQ